MPWKMTIRFRNLLCVAHALLMMACFIGCGTRRPVIEPPVFPRFPGQGVEVYPGKLDQALLYEIVDRQIPNHPSEPILGPAYLIFEVADGVKIQEFRVEEGGEDGAIHEHTLAAQHLEKAGSCFHVFETHTYFVGTTVVLDGGAEMRFDFGAAPRQFFQLTGHAHNDYIIYFGKDGSRVVARPYVDKLLRL